MRSGQFVIVVEGMPGLSNQRVSTLLEPGEDQRPDLQIQSTRPMGNGSPAVCDTGPASQGGGGIPGINPPSFGPGSAITNALNDFACRFQHFTPGAPCTFTDASGDPKVITPGTTAQFCDFMATTEVFPPGDSLVTVRLRDVIGNTGPPAQMVVRVATPMPTPLF